MDQKIWICDHCKSRLIEIKQYVRKEGKMNYLNKIIPRVHGKKWALVGGLLGGKDSTNAEPTNQVKVTPRRHTFLHSYFKYFIY